MKIDVPLYMQLAVMPEVFHRHVLDCQSERESLSVATGDTIIARVHNYNMVVVSEGRLLICT